MFNNFIEAVRNSKIKLPNQYDFNAEHWANYFRASKSRTNVEERLFNAGKWFYEHSKPVRDQTNKVFRNLLSTGLNENLLRLQVGMINHCVSKSWSNSWKELFSNPTTQSLKQLSITEFQEPISILESFVTAARYPIAKTAKELTKAHTQEMNESCNILDSINSAISLGESYALLENLWNECLWNNWYINDTKSFENKYSCNIRHINDSQDSEVIGPADFKREEIYQINLHRWNSIWQEGLIDDWQALSIEDRRAISTQPRISARLVNEQQEICLRICNSLSNQHGILPNNPTLAVGLFLKQEFYPKSLLDKNLPKLQNIKLIQLLAVWSTLR